MGTGVFFGKQRPGLNRKRGRDSFSGLSRK
jgi:hypothetical protein